jgi:pimeloyl-ACP methyl ester carboxylesterase
MTVLVAERIGELDYHGHRLEYTEYGGGDRVVVLLHGQLMPRRMHEPLARVLAAEGHHVYTLDLLGHGRSDRPSDPALYSMTAFGHQVVALLDHLGVERAVVGGTSLGANTTLEVAAQAPERLRGMIIEMPVLDNAVEAGIIAFAPLLFVARAIPIAVTAVRRVAQAVPRTLVPFWSGIALDTLSQEPDAMGAAIHGIFYGRVAPPRHERIRITVPALVVGHPRDPVHPAADAAMLAEELVSCRFVEAASIVEWRRHPDRLNGEAVDFLRTCWDVDAADDVDAAVDA